MREQDRIIRQLEAQFGIRASTYSVHPTLGTVTFFLPNRRRIVLLHVPGKRERTGKFKLQITCPTCGRLVWSQALTQAAELDAALNGDVGPDGQHTAICKKTKDSQEPKGEYNEPVLRNNDRQGQD
jgi:hypothetical protein